MDWWTVPASQVVRNVFLEPDQERLGKLVSCRAFSVTCVEAVSAVGDDGPELHRVVDLHISTSSP